MGEGGGATEKGRGDEGRGGANRERGGAEWKRMESIRKGRG